MVKGYAAHESATLENVTEMRTRAVERDDRKGQLQGEQGIAEALKQVSPSIAGFARQEGLEGHARSVESRFEEAEA